MPKVSLPTTSPATLRFYDVVRECNLNNTDVHRVDPKIGSGPASG